MISPLAYIDPEAQIGQNVEIAPFVYDFIGFAGSQSDKL